MAKKINLIDGKEVLSKTVKPKSLTLTENLVAIGMFGLFTAGFLIGETKGSPNIIKIVKFPYADNTII